MTAHLAKTHKITETGVAAQQPDIREELKRQRLPAERQEHLEYLMARAFVCAGVPMNVANSVYFREFLYELSPNFRAPRSDTLTGADW